MRTNKKKHHNSSESNHSKSSPTQSKWVDQNDRTKENSILQAKLKSSKKTQTTSSAIIQKKNNNTGLPNNLKSGIENLSGYSMDDVKVQYNSEKPAQLNAHAFAQGTNIHLASGQEKHLPHEAWHVVQQKQGRVKPTTQLQGKVNINDDAGLEKEADVMGNKAIINNTQTQSTNVTKEDSNVLVDQTIQRQISNKGKPVSKGTLVGAIQAERTNTRKNPYKIPFIQSLTNHMFNYYNIVFKGNIEIDAVVRTYWRVLTATMDAENVKAAAMNSLMETLSSESNIAKSRKISSSGFGGDPLVIYRGTSPVQATQILINKTLGGVSSAGKNLPSPGEDAASKQTGENIKDTDGGRIEEWSWKPGGLTGFSTEGVMLVGLVNKSSVAITPIKIGEMGATGYANQPLLDVAIYNEGAKSVVPSQILFEQEARKIFDKSTGALDKTQAKPKASGSTSASASASGSTKSKFDPYFT